MNVGYLQFAPLFGESEKNLEAIREHILAHLQGGGTKPDLLVLPELALSGYLFLSQEEVARMAEPVDTGPCIEALSRLAQETGIHLVTGFAEEEMGRYYNSAVLLTPEGRRFLYRKMHLFAEEKYFFSPGDLGFPVFTIQGVRVALLVCFDHMFPEAARTVALQGAHVVCHPSNLVLPEYGQLTTRVRAIENRIFWILANRIGVEERGGKRLRYTGRSHVISPKGTILAQAPEEEAALHVVEIDPKEAEDKHVTPHNHLFHERRLDYYILFSA
ncbi:Nitrilase/cyanide hydratase and apolipoprotein N-acyltransferase [Spirochaeta thermophila DSM 6578]|uniref:Nitrilase/cyanide hydratase and apolipoprotein N-acyltransferase n=1 Tax=Winmispira thermophila (strain ATCC 700085 / DSM 6578 / Z-1203) TaxID=869211 RepID=G0GF76_WINT7|nr:nitrilase-related carbon-nitrogen hydrolase [Spirochaeta thermophila]AEJ60775.1 Nitrilase/cyanide hydratase and apolipoprotein N-acyltransferase [Spirochaeta thermophila DSM 6578]